MMNFIKNIRSNRCRKFIADYTSLQLMANLFIGIILFLPFACISQNTSAINNAFYTTSNIKYGSSNATAVEIKMEDGIVLKGLAYYPVSANNAIAKETFPVIIEMTPYPERDSPKPQIIFNEHGYIYLIVRPRGTGGSEGEVQQFNSRDGLDGKNVVYWAAEKLQGSNGSVGLFGCSYPGAIALATAAKLDKKSPVKAAITACIGLNMQHRQVWSTNGLPNGALSAYAPNAKSIMGDYPAASRYWSKFHENYMAGGEEAYDGYWQDRLPLQWAKNIVDNNIPVLLWGGWQDINEIGAVHAFVAFQNALNGREVFKPMHSNEAASAKYQLIMGDWGHGDGLEPSIFIQWFDTWIKGIKTGMESTKNPLHIYETGSERWINTDRYPLVNQYQKYYLNSNNMLATSKSLTAGNETLIWTKPSQKDGKAEFATSVFTNGATLAGPMCVTLYAILPFSASKNDFRS